DPKLRVVATLPDLFILTRAVAGDLATVDLIARFGQNPHDMEVRPSQILMVRRADVLVRNGLEEDAWIDVMVHGAANPRMLRGAGIVSYHDSWPYFYRAFGLVEAGVIEDRPGIPPSPQHLANLIRSMREQKVKVILHESWYPSDVTSRVAKETGAKMVVVAQSPGALKGTEDYIAHLDHLVSAIAAALK